MNMKEFAKKQECKNFFEGIVQQARKNYEPETIEAAEECFYSLFTVAETMSGGDADAYLSACLGLFILESYSTSDERIGKVTPREK